MAGKGPSECRPEGRQKGTCGISGNSIEEEGTVWAKALRSVSIWEASVAGAGEQESKAGGEGGVTSGGS